MSGADGEHRYTPQEITYYLKYDFAAPLILSTIGFVIFGVNLCQFFFYFQNVARRDHLFTKVWVGLVGIMTAVATLYEVKVNWIFSISLWEQHGRNNPSIALGNLVVLYSVVVMLVQFFWLSCIRRLLFTKPRLAWCIIMPIGFASFASFILSIAVAVVSRLDQLPNGAWPTPKSSALVRSVLGLDLAVDLSILIVIISQLAVLKKSSRHLKTTITKLSWILCLLTLASTLTIIGELYISTPETGSATTSSIPIVISFAPTIPPIYLASFLAVLNAREDVWSQKSRRQPEVEGEGSSRQGLIPGLKFTVDLPDETNSTLSRETAAPALSMNFVHTEQPRVEEEAKGD